MNYTIEKALQTGIVAHKEGKLQDAERLYRLVLKFKPSHPDANHNLGVLVFSVNKVDAALPFFKTALEANPNIEQFWLSYINALIEGRRFDDAKEILRQAVNQGIGEEKLRVFEGKITRTLQGNNPEVRSEQQPNILLDHYQKGRLNDAEKLALSVIKECPKHPLAWKVLGALFRQSGRYLEAVNANQTAVSISPRDAEAHNNLGNTLRELGRLEQAETYLRQAIVLKPDYAEAKSNFGIIRKDLGDLHQAEVSFIRAITLKPDYAEAHYNLGVNLEESGRLETLEESFRQAIMLKPDYAEAHNNLGVILKKLDRWREAETSYIKAIVLKSNNFEAYNNLGNTFQELGRLSEAEKSCKQAIAFKPDYSQAYSNLGIVQKELGHVNQAEVSYKQALTLTPDHSEAYYNLGIMLQQTGKLEEARACYRQVLSFKPHYLEARSNLLTCLYLLDNESQFFDELDYLINWGRCDAVIGSLIGRSALKYGQTRPNLFCREPLKYVSHIDLNTKYDFQKIFVENAKSILKENRISNRKQTLLVNGCQTSGNLFDIENNFTDKIQQTIRLEIEKYRMYFSDSEEGFIINWPTEYNLYGWLISMKSGGELRPHIHSQGWLSGSIYISIPRKLKADSGNLVVSLGEEEDATGTQMNLKKVIDVVTGSLVLFPSSLTHYTIPFKADEQRIVLAFDVQQK